MKIKACITNKSDLWKTPKQIYNHFIKNNYFDPCPTNPQFDGLKIKWKSFNFINPPYSQITKWIDKALEERKRHCNSVLLIPARTDTQWFKKLIKNNVSIWFIEGRLHFNDEGPAPFPSMLVEISYFNVNSETNYFYLEKKDFNYFFD